jgi:Secretion system C-terminal sorting domain
MKHIVRVVFIIFLILGNCSVLSAQKSNYAWAFGDSAGIDFTNLSNPQPIETGMRSRGSCVSIADTSGNLLFYANTRASLPGYTTKVYNKLNQEMSNGYNVAGRGWYKELLIIPMPDNFNKYYLFTLSISTIIGLYYSVVDMSLNNGLGDVIVKNVKLHGVWMADCINAIKHANGRDWWIFMRTTQNNYDDKYYKYLVTPFGIDSLPAQQIGTGSGTGFIEFKWNKNGDRLAMVNFDGLIELYDFDRCSGMLSNPVTIRQQVMVSPVPSINFCEFSASGNFLYVSANPGQPDSSRLIQIDLRNYPNNITQDTLWATFEPKYTAGALKRGPDDKIYFSCAYVGSTGNNYPYADTMYNQYNMNLGVINSPDSLGLACDFQPWSFYLGGKRTYWGLPNNPDYDMGPVVGSICDSLSTGIASINDTKGVIQKVFPNPNSGAFYLELKQTFMEEVYAELYSLQGQLCARQLLDNTHYTTAIRFDAVQAGVYILKLRSPNSNLGTMKVIITK